MTRSRPLLLIHALAAALIACALLATPAAANLLSGSEACLKNNGLGRINAYFYPYHNGSASWFFSPDYYNACNADPTVSADAGLHLSIYSADETSATVYGWRGQMPFTNVTPPAGGYGSGTPDTLTSSYSAGSLKVDETITYASPDTTLRSGQVASLQYHITNTSNDTPIKFRATYGADIEPGGDRGVGYSSGSSGSRHVGAVNQYEGAALQLDEDATTPWSAAMEGDAYEVWRRVAKPLAAGVSGVRGDALLDAGLAAQWDGNGLGTTGLAPGASVDVKVGVRDFDYNDALAVPTDVTLPSGGSQTVTLTASEPDGTATDVDPADTNSNTGTPQPIRYRISGDNPTAGSDYVTATNVTGPGTADVSWDSVARADGVDYYYYYGNGETYDTLTAFVDYNNNGTRDANEPTRSTSVTWFDQVHSWDDNCYAYYSSFLCEHWTGTTAHLRVRILDSNQQPMTGKAFAYEVMGANGSNRLAGVTSDGTDPNGDGSGPNGPPAGEAVIDLLGINAGHSTVKVYADLSGNDTCLTAGSCTATGDVATYKYYWISRLHTVPSRQVLTAGPGETTTLQLAVHDENGNPLALDDQVHYSINGPNGNGSDQLSGVTSSTYCDTYYYNGDYAVDNQLYWYSSASCVTITVPGDQVGRDTITAWYDETGDGHTADDPTDTATVDWLATDQYGGGIDRLRIDDTAGYYRQGVTGGDPVTYHLSALNDDGSVCSSNCPVMLYQVQGLNPTAILPAGSGTGTITLNSSQTGHDYVNVWVDENGDHEPDNGEPTKYLSIYWYNAVDFDYGSTSDTHYVSETESTYVYLRNADGSPAASTPFVYTITGPDSGGTRTVSTPVQTNSSGYAPVSWQTDSPGTDLLTVKADLNADDTCHVASPPNPCTDGFGDDPGETGTFNVVWKNRVEITLNTPSPNLGDQASVTACFYDDPSPANRSFHFEVTGKNPTTGDVTSTDHGTYSCSAPIKWTGTNAGTDTVTVSVDADKNGTYDVAGARQVSWYPLDLHIDHLEASAETTRTATATYYDPSGQPVKDAVIRYSVSGFDSIPGRPVQTTDDNGRITFSWTGQPYQYPSSGYFGSDSVQAYVDLNGNATLDTNEPHRELTVKWYQRLVPSVTSAYGRAQGSNYTVDVNLYDDNHVAIPSHQLRYTIAGANPTTDPGTVTTDSTGKASVTWTGDNATTNGGQDTLLVWDDNGDGIKQASEHSTYVTVNWTPRLTISPTYSMATGQQRSVSIHLINPASQASAGKTVYWTVTGANSASGSFVTDNNGYGNAQWTGLNAGTDTLTAYAEENGTDGRQSDEPQASTTAVWTNNLSLTVGNTTDYVDPASPKTHNISAHLSGANNANAAVTYTITGANATSGNTTTNGSGDATIPVVGANPGSDTISVTSNGFTAVVSLTWKPMLNLQPQGGATHTAGSSNSVTVNVTLVDRDGTPRSGVALDWAVTGTNTAGNATGALTTDGNGNASFVYVGANSGDDTVTATVHNAVAGDPQGQTTITWQPPPLKFTLSPSAATHFAHPSNTSTVTATLDNYTIPVGGMDVYFTVTGPDAQGPTLVHTSTNQAQFTWNGSYTAGTDSVTAWADISGTAGSKDSFDPSASAGVLWQSLVASSSSSGSSPSELLGGTHSETVTIRDQNGNPLPGADVIYRIDGANQSSADPNAYLPRPISATSTGAFYQARPADGSGNVTISWVGNVAGTDVLTVVQDINSDGIAQPSEPRTTSVVNWSGSTAPPSTGTPTGTTTTTTDPNATSAATPSTAAAVVPGSPEDFDGFLTPPPPVVAKRVNVEPVSGTVKVRIPGSNKFIDLLDAEQVPVGSVVDTTKGVVALTAAQNLKGAVATANFYEGVFQIAQKKAAKPVTDLVLFGGSFAPCAKIGKKSQRASLSQKKEIRHLWGKGHGLFRTKGKYASATIRGTTYEVADFCDGTLVKVTNGAVTVQDFVNKKSKVLKAPKTLFIPAKKK